MVADHRLHNGQSQPSAVLLGGVVRREQPVTFFRREPGAGVGKLENGELMIQLGAEGQLAALGHGINRIEHQILNHAAQQHRIAVDRRDRAQLQLGLNARLPARDLSLEELHHAADQFVEINRLKLRRRHLGKIAEAADDGLQIGDLREQGSGALAEDLVELRGRFFPRAQQVLYRDLQREERVLELMGQPSRQFAPGRHAFALHQALALRDQLLGHLVEGGGQFPDLVLGTGFHAHIPVALANFRGGAGQSLDGAAETRGDDAAHDHAQRHADPGDGQADVANAYFQGRFLRQRVADQKHRGRAVGIAGQGDGVDNLFFELARSPVNCGRDLGALVHDFLQQRHQLRRSEAIFRRP